MKRILTSLVLVPVTIYTVLFAPWQVFLPIVAIVAALCFREYAAITGSLAAPGYVAGLLLLIAPPAWTTPILLLTALAALSVSLSASPVEQATARSGTWLLGVIYVFGGWKAAILLHEIHSPRLTKLAAGHHWLMFALVVNWAGDTGAYYVGRKFGRRKLAPAISPGKTWEGAFASLLAATIFGLIYLPLAIPGTALGTAAALALAANIAGQTGDLAESAIKRSAGVKDSGTLLPGHGGLLDRVDSSLFTMPVLYALVSLLASLY